MEWIVQLPLVFFSVVVHELSKGWTAFAKGDRSPEEQGRLTLNPIPHIDPFGTVFLPLFCYALKLPMFGWAKPMPVDSARLSKPRDVVQLAVAGPFAHLLLALASAVLFKLSAGAKLFAPEFQKTVQDALLFGVSINLLLGFFNLLPLHPLDGSRLVAGLLSPSMRERYERHFPYAAALVLVLLLTRALDGLVVSPSRAALGVLTRAELVW